MNFTEILKYLGTKVFQIIKWILFLIVYLTASSMITLSGAFGNKVSLAQEVLGMGLIACAVALAFIDWCYHTQLQTNNPRHFGKNKVNVQKILLIFGLYILMNVIQITWSILISKNIISFPTNQTDVEQAAMQLPIWSNLFAVFIAPIFEELIFRGIFMNYFFNKNNHFNNFMAILFSGVLFGLAHEPKPDLNLLMYSALGWVLAFTYMHFKDIRYNIFLHFLNNLASVL